MTNNRRSRSQPTSPDPAWTTEFEQVIRQLPPPHRPALLDYLRHRHPSSRLFIHIDDAGTAHPL